MYFVGYVIEISFLLQVQLLVSPKDIENYKKIGRNLEDLKLLVEEAELWVQKVTRSEEDEAAVGVGGEGRQRVRINRFRCIHVGRMATFK